MWKSFLKSIHFPLAAFQQHHQHWCYTLTLSTKGTIRFLHSWGSPAPKLKMPSNSSHTKCARTESCCCCRLWCSSGRAFHSITNTTAIHFSCKVKAPSLSVSLHSAQLQNWKCPAMGPTQKVPGQKAVAGFYLLPVAVQQRHQIALCPYLAS